MPIMKMNVDVIPDKFNISYDENVFIAKRLLVDSIYQQANLEGIATTYAQTVDILNDINVDSLTPTDISKICCLRDGWHYLLDNLDSPLNLAFLESLHELVARFDVPYMYLGKLRVDPVLISGTSWRPELPNSESLHEWLADIDFSKNTTDMAIKTGLQLMRIQPFKDGNKRIGSFVINKVLIRYGKGLFNVPVELDGEFKQRLVDYYSSNDMSSLSWWIYRNCIVGV